MRNVEFKAELRDLAVARGICRTIGAVPSGILEQVDTYFNVPSGRLKKRETRGAPTEYVAYERADKPGARVSVYTLYSEDEAAARFGTLPLPVRVIVRKSRELRLLHEGSVRIHLDRVDDLGTFLEFEAIVSPQRGIEESTRVVVELRRAFAPALGEPISASYADLLSQSQR